MGKRAREASVGGAYEVTASDVAVGRIPQTRALAVAADQRSEGQVQALRWQSYLQVHALCRTATPYGTIRKQLVFGDGADRFMVDYICPLAMLHHLGEKAPDFVSFVLSHLRDGRGRVAFYLDDVKPGNALRVDQGRKYTAVYWSILELPHWYRVGDGGWMPLLFVQVGHLRSAGVTVASLTRQVFRALWNPADGAFNLATTGVRFGSGHLFLDFCCFLADEAGLKEMLSVKGAAGSKPCLLCLNCVGRCPRDEVGEGMFHYSNPDLSGMMPATPAMLNVMAERLRDARGSSRGGARGASRARGRGRVTQ